MTNLASIPLWRCMWCKANVYLEDGSCSRCGRGDFERKPRKKNKKK